MMKKIPSVITKVELSRAYDEGKLAFNENRRRSYNPYVATNQGLAMAWWHGWDTGQEESKRPPQSGNKEPNDHKK